MWTLETVDVEDVAVGSSSLVFWQIIPANKNLLAVDDARHHHIIFNMNRNIGIRNVVDRRRVWGLKYGLHYAALLALWACNNTSAWGLQIPCDPSPCSIPCSSRHQAHWRENTVIFTIGSTSVVSVVV